MGMKAVLVANPKGGSGKTTVATNLAAALAGRQAKVALWDLDQQQSTSSWLGVRSPDYPQIRSLRGQAGEPKSAQSDWLILDSPAGLRGKNLEHALKLAHKVVVPVQPSLFDMAATAVFLTALKEEKAVRQGKTFVAVVGVRVDPRTRAASTLEAFLQQFDLPVLTYLRDTQVYANASFNGLSIFDLPSYISRRDIEQWQPLLEWVYAD
jgi:chromosome partitioning protein